MKKLLLLAIWFPATILTLTGSLVFYHYRLNFLKEKINSSQLLAEIYQNYSFLPRVLGFSYDPRLEKISAYLKKYHSPMEKDSQQLVESAYKYEIDPFLMVAIAQCETNLGKKSPPDCYNPFGLGVYGKKRLCFENWEQSFELMAKTLRKKYHDYGLVTPEEIMEKYCPTSIEKSDGHWAKCVNRFKKEVENISL